MTSLKGLLCTLAFSACIFACNYTISNAMYATYYSRNTKATTLSKRMMQTSRRKSIPVADEKRESRKLKVAFWKFHVIFAFASATTRPFVTLSSFFVQ